MVVGVVKFRSTHLPIEIALWLSKVKELLDTFVLGSRIETISLTLTLTLTLPLSAIRHPDAASTDT